jgi:hypothetical protein
MRASESKPYDVVRPDGYVAWVSRPGDASAKVRDGLRCALTAWFGAPHETARSAQRDDR